MKTARCLMIAILPLALVGCANNPYASNSTTANTAGGSLLGAVAGAVIGNQTGSPLAGAAIGAGLGGLAGYGISNSQQQAPAPHPVTMQRHRAMYRAPPAMCVHRRRRNTSRHPPVRQDIPATIDKLEAWRQSKTSGMAPRCHVYSGAGMAATGRAE